MAKKKKHGSELNLFDCVPETCFSWKENEESRVVVDMPRFHVAWMQKYLVPSRKSPYIKITLDEFGSSTWKLIDGKRTAAEIATQLVEIHGEEIAPVDDRLVVFFRQLKERGFIRFIAPDGTLLK